MVVSQAAIELAQPPICSSSLLAILSRDYNHYKKTMFFLTSEKMPIGVILNMGFVFLDVT